MEGGCSTLQSFLDQVNCYLYLIPLRITVLDCSEIIKLTAKPRNKKDFSGVYYFLEIKNGKPAYKHENKDFYLFFKGWWKVDSLDWYLTPKEKSSGFISSNDNAVCPDKVKAGSWKNLGEANMDEGIFIGQGYCEAKPSSCRLSEG